MDYWSNNRGRWRYRKHKKAHKFEILLSTLVFFCKIGTAYSSEYAVFLTYNFTTMSFFACFVVIAFPLLALSFAVVNQRHCSGDYFGKYQRIMTPEFQTLKFVY